MTSASKNTRRDFLRGKAALDALTDSTGALIDAIRPDQGSTASASQAAPPSEPASDGYQLHFKRRAMACDFEIILPACASACAAEVAIEALDLVEALEAQLTVYRDTSEIMALNRGAASAPQLVEARLFALLEQAVRIHRDTAGAYDITSGPLTKVWGFYQRAGAVPTADAIAAALATVGSQYLEFDRTAQTIQFSRPGVEINLGSIGKGHALDRCDELLTHSGLGDVLLHGGQSSVLARGTAPGRGAGWSVGVRDPRRPTRHVAEICLHDRALSTSGAGVQFFKVAGRRYGHLLDPRTGWPAEGVLSATALAPTAAEADALSTAFYVWGIEGARDYCADHPEIGLLLIEGRLDEPRDRIHLVGLGPEDVRIVRDEPA